MKIDRLVSIIMVLLEHKKISAPKLAEMFEVTPRTIYRDIETLLLAGIPIVSTPGINGGISIMEEYKIDKKLFTIPDITTLLMGLGSLSSTLSNKEVKNVLEKVKTLVPKEQSKEIELRSNQISIDLNTWAGNKSLLPNIENFKSALNESRHVSFLYSDNKGNVSDRTVEPYQLILKENSWYLQAYCLNKKDFRIFKLVRISKLKILDTKFVPKEFIPKPLDGRGWIDKRLVTIKLLIDKSILEYVIDRCGEENIEEVENNKFMIHFPFVEDDFGYNILLGYGDKCECIEPIHVRNELIRRIERLLDKYHS